MFGINIPIKWFVTYDFKGVTYYLVSTNDTARDLLWSQQQAKALKFDSSADAEKLLDMIKSYRKNKKLEFKIR